MLDYSTTTDTPDSDESNIRTALYNYIEAAYSNERIAILIDDIPVNTLCGFTSAENKDILFSVINSDISADSSGYDLSIDAALKMFSESSTTPNRSIILLANTACRISDSTLQNAATANVKITTIGFGKHVDEDGLLKIADSTGGKFYMATSTAELWSTLSTHTGKNADILVLGKYNADGVSYLKVAEELDATYYSNPWWDDLADIYGEKEMWEINETFLKTQTDAGKTIVFSHSPEIAKVQDKWDGSSFGVELQFHEDEGYSIIWDNSQHGYYYAIKN